MTGKIRAAARRRGTVTAALLATIAATVAGCTGKTVDGIPSSARTSGSPATSSSSTHATAAGVVVPCSTDSTSRADTVALFITSALQHRSKSSLLALMSGQAASAAGIWYDNLASIGFTTGGAAPVQPKTIDEAQNPAIQHTVMTIGVHNAFDEALSGIGPDTPATQYALTTDERKSGSSCRLSVSGWSSVNHAPWDVNQHLTVVHTAHTVVAGEPAIASTVHRVASEAETAAKFDFDFLKDIGRGEDARVSGFVMFVPTSAAQANSWFSYPGSSKPSGWTADVGHNAEGVEYPLGGVQVPLSAQPGAPKVSQVSEIGGGRVILTPTALAESSKEQTAVLTHEFAHDIYNNYNDGWFTGQPVDAALAEGTANYFEVFYLLNPTLNEKQAVNPMAVLGPVIRQHRSLLNGKVPTRSQIYGQASLAGFYYDVSASCIVYLGHKYGLKFAFQSVRDAYANGGGPFSGVVTSIKNGAITFADQNSYVRPWATWLRNQL